MNNTERIEQINSIKKELDPLNQERIFRETKLYFLKEAYTKYFRDEDKNEINKLQSELNDIYQQLNPLFIKLRELQSRYIIEYKGELYNPETGKFYWKTENESFFLKNSCNIDTWNNGWDKYVSDACVSDLIKEITEIIYLTRFTKFEILNIKRL